MGRRVRPRLGPGRGFGRGYGLGWGGNWDAPYAANPYAVPYAAPYPAAYGLGSAQEIDVLKGQAEYFEDALEGIKKRITELESETEKK